MKYLRVYSLLLLFAALITGCSKTTNAPATAPATASSAAPVTAPTASSQFVQVQGRQFMLAGKPYYVVGANMWYGAYLGAPSALGDRTRLQNELDLLKANGVNNLRVLAISESSDLLRAVRPAMINRNGEFNQDLLQGLDYLLAEMAKRDMKAVLYLNNFWQWSGGMSQYVAWITGTPVLDPDLTGKWNEFMQNSARFYSLDEAQKKYQAAISQIITRTNSITGTAYNQDPTIMSWQLANEPRPGSDAEGRANVPAFNHWIKTSARYIHQLAPHQLVSSGNEGAMGSIGDINVYAGAHAIPEIDYLTFHMWVKNWGWFDGAKPAETYAGALQKAKDYVDAHIQIANNLNKPLVLEEFGLDRDGGGFAPSTPVSYRDKYYAAVFDWLVAGAKAGDAIAGYNFWAWGGFGKTGRADFIWQAGDDVMGDPPQEPQGLNSVFAADASTLAVIKKSAVEFSHIGQ